MVQLRTFNIHVTFIIAKRFFKVEKGPLDNLNEKFTERLKWFLYVIAVKNDFWNLYF